MGAQQTKATSYSFIARREDQRFGVYKLLQSGAQQWAAVSRSFGSYEEYVQFNAWLCNQKNLGPGFLKIQSQNSEEGSLCSSVYQVTILYEFTEETLANTPFKIPLLELKSLCQSLKDLYSQGHTHGSISPDFISVVNKSLKIHCVQQITGYNCLKRALVSLGNWYLAPELLPTLGTRNFKSYIDWQKQDVYSLGLTILYNLMQFDVQLLYDKQAYTFNHQFLQQTLAHFQVIFGDELYELVSWMLTQNPNQRAGFEALCQKLSHIKYYDPDALQTALTNNFCSPEKEEQKYKIQEVEQQNEPIKSAIQSNQPSPDKQAKKEKEYTEERTNNKLVIEETHNEEAQNQNTLPISPKQKIKDYYVSGSISSHFRSSDYGQQVAGTAYFPDDSIEKQVVPLFSIDRSPLQEVKEQPSAVKPIDSNKGSKLQSRSHSKTPSVQKLTPASQISQQKGKPVSLKRPKNDEKKIPSIKMRFR